MALSGWHCRVQDRRGEESSVKESNGKGFSNRHQMVSIRNKTQVAEWIVGYRLVE